jgi:glycosyltransferase involved in cell wall biosynthesis
MAVPLLGKPCLYKTAIPGDDDPATIRRTRGGGVKRALIGRYDRFPAISTLVAGMLSADGIEPGRIAAIPNGVEGRFRPGTAAEREAARARLLPAHAFPPGTLLVLYVGSVERRKGIDTLAHAWLRVAAEVPAARLLMVGPGDPDGAYFRDVGVILGRELGSTAVIADRVADPLECYRAADLFVFPSRNESFGNVLVEAMACGLPVVATRIDGVTGDLVTDRADGLVVPNEDPAALARALLELLRDPGLRARLGGEAARTVDARFRIDRVAAKYLELYRGLTAGR